MATWPLYERVPTEITAGQFYQVAFSQWLGVTDALEKSRPSGRHSYVFQPSTKEGTITWYGNVAFHENAHPKLLADETGIETENPDYRGEMYCITLPNKACAIDQFVNGYNRFVVKTGENLSEPSGIILNFNYDRRWKTNQGTISLIMVSGG